MKRGGGLRKPGGMGIKKSVVVVKGRLGGQWRGKIGGRGAKNLWSRGRLDGGVILQKKGPQRGGVNSKCWVI